MNILFLDYDGVVNTPMWQLSSKGEMRCLFNFPDDNKVNNFQACQWISEFCQKYDYKIVVTSSWRFYKNYKDCLINGGLREGIEIFGRTPSLRHDHATRGEEIQTWLNQHTEVENFIIVDDEDDMEPIDKEKHFIECNGNVGFGLTEFIKAEKLHKMMMGVE